ncbi:MULTISPECIES: hypothetical protein [Pseudomonas syringae group]|uniref:hypothetical protein n=1 Tax=Pseudomonas syringae group TaxID=136849 RepID=UPI0011C3A1F8|nr:hypothetical protein [Pseudomonas syringae group genomosp. 3]
MEWMILIFAALLLNALLIWSGLRAVLRRIRDFQEVVLGCENTMATYGQRFDEKLYELISFSDEISRKLSDLERIEDHLSSRRPNFPRND